MFHYFGCGSNGTEEDVAVGERTPAQQAYLNTFLYSDAEEYTYVGRLVAEG